MYVEIETVSRSALRALREVVLNIDGIGFGRVGTGANEESLGIAVELEVKLEIS
jgi:hypothetical protein